MADINARGLVLTQRMPEEVRVGFSDVVSMLLMVAVPYFVGMSPGLMPAAVPMPVKWGLLVLLFLGSIWIRHGAGRSPHGLELIIFIPFWTGLLVGSVLLVKRHSSRPGT